MSEQTFGKCTFTTCRYLKDGNCTNEYHRNLCIEVKHNEQLMFDEVNKRIMDNVKE